MKYLIFPTLTDAQAASAEAMNRMFPDRGEASTLYLFKAVLLADGRGALEIPELGVDDVYRHLKCFTITDPTKDVLSGRDRNLLVDTIERAVFVT